MAESSNDKENQPPSKKPRLSLSLKKGRKQDNNNSSFSRFGKVSNSELQEATKGVLPANTKKANTWAIKNFTEWKQARDTDHPDDTVPEKLLCLSDTETVCKWLCRYIMETRQENGQPYPPKSLYSLLCGLYRHSRANGVSFNFMDKGDIRFRDLHYTLDSLFSELHSKGIGASSKGAAVISFEDEELLWEKEVLTFANPKGLQRMVFVYVGLHFC